MDHYCVVGNPVEHSQSPRIHARFAELTGQSLHYQRQRVEPGGFQAALAALRTGGFKGCNVTVPFKFEAFAAAARTTARAQLAQAANTLWFEGSSVHADNTDGAGLVHDIVVNAGVALEGRDVLLIGAGGAAAGVLGPLLLARPRRLVVTNRTLAKAVGLVARHSELASTNNLLSKTELIAQGTQALQADFDVIVNATASSLAGAASPVPASALKPGALAYDMMYGPASLPFMHWANGQGATARDGLGMLVEQAALAFETWRGVRPPAARVLGELRAALDAAEAANA